MQRTIPGPVGRRHREQLRGEIVRGYYGWLNNHPPFRQALRELFEAAYPPPPRGGSRRTLRAHTVRQFVERWNLPRRYGARDLASSFAQWVLAATLRPRLLHGARYPGGLDPIRRTSKMRGNSPEKMSRWRRRAGDDGAGHSHGSTKRRWWSCAARAARPSPRWHGSSDCDLPPPFVPLPKLEPERARAVQA